MTFSKVVQWKTHIDSLWVIMWQWVANLNNEAGFLIFNAFPLFSEWFVIFEFMSTPWTQRVFWNNRKKVKISAISNQFQWRKRISHQHVKLPIQPRICLFAFLAISRANLQEQVFYTREIELIIWISGFSSCFSIAT